MKPSDLVEAWRIDAQRLRDRYSDPRAAELFEKCARELEQAIEHDGREESYSLTEASLLSGYTPDYLGRLVASGIIENAGRPNRPRIRRRDLPRKAGHHVPPVAPGAPETASIRSIGSRAVGSRTRG